MMNKKFSLAIIILVFLAVQMLSVLHMAGYGFAEHKHHGKACDIAVFCEHNKIAGVASSVTAPTSDFYVVTNISIIGIIAESREYSKSSPRSPPFSLFS
jgi:hypothetical protein